MLSKPSWILFLLTIKTFKDDENLLVNVTFPYKTLILIRLSHRRDQKFVTSSVQSATETRQRGLQQITDGFYRFFTILSWYSKVRDSESLLFQLAVNRD